PNRTPRYTVDLGAARIRGEYHQLPPSFPLLRRRSLAPLFSKPLRAIGRRRSETRRWPRETAFSQDRPAQDIREQSQNSGLDAALSSLLLWRAGDRPPGNNTNRHSH